ncbi:hypothetical protein CRUP_032845 [Coryphaenoides rupestris]|nr:hypothetical protein CRUP_032845 [Coryphaenoides rupestris]
MRRMESGDMALGMLDKLWVKLQGLSSAEPIELGAFVILLAFILLIVLMMVLTCVTCCCCKSTSKGSKR